ncbi:hypothetical protein FOZG_00865 [Fusarium oxysporum Fo47]|uniref:Uncharacterized protein n=1 Tax=Fusarium oxysporum Fo47 TaxID=660027 RepID=W9L5J5_FUSOX|nr:hypothetical protein FOZG_00865 [Fusarium oxysporum Fo47]
MSQRDFAFEHEQNIIPPGCEGLNVNTWWATYTKHVALLSCHMYLKSMARVVEKETHGTPVERFDGKDLPGGQELSFCHWMESGIGGNEWEMIQIGLLHFEPSEGQAYHKKNRGLGVRLLE